MALSRFAAIGSANSRHLRRQSRRIFIRKLFVKREFRSVVRFVPICSEQLKPLTRTLNASQAIHGSGPQSHDTEWQDIAYRHQSILPFRRKK